MVDVGHPRQEECLSHAPSRCLHLFLAQRMLVDKRCHTHGHRHDAHAIARFSGQSRALDTEYTLRVLRKQFVIPDDDSS